MLYVLCWIRCTSIPFPTTLCECFFLHDVVCSVAFSLASIYRYPRSSWKSVVYVCVPRVLENIGWGSMLCKVLFPTVLACISKCCLEQAASAKISIIYYIYSYICSRLCLPRPFACHTECCAYIVPGNPCKVIRGYGDRG